VGDISNAAMVRCNLSSLLRTQATWEMTKYSDSKDIDLLASMPSEGNGNNDGHRNDSLFLTYYERALNFLKNAQKHCDFAVLSFDNSTSSQGNIRNVVALETAQIHLNIGILKKSEIFRSHVYGSNDGDKFEIQSLLFAEKERDIISAFETSLEIFYEFHNERQAAAHYQLGSFYSSYWPLYPLRSDALLEKALLHYQEAHRHYSKYDVGPTLLLILTDMCDLYLSAYSASEPFLNTAKNSQDNINLHPLDPNLNTSDDDNNDGNYNEKNDKNNIINKSNNIIDINENCGSIEDASKNNDTVNLLTSNKESALLPCTNEAFELVTYLFKLIVGYLYICASIV
jgi:hypothetical protein